MSRLTRNRRRCPRGRRGGQINAIYSIKFSIRPVQDAIQLQMVFANYGDADPLYNASGPITPKDFDPSGIYIKIGGVLTECTVGAFSGGGLINLTFPGAAAGAGEIVVPPLLRSMAFRGVIGSPGFIGDFPAFP